jgi:hypothetical protein
MKNRMSLQSLVRGFFNQNYKRRERFYITDKHDRAEKSEFSSLNFIRRAPKAP